MRKANACVRTACHGNIREVDGISDVAVFNVILQLLCGHHSAVILAFRRGSAKVRDRDDVFDPEQRVIREVRRIRGNGAVCKRRQHRVGIDERPAREV